MTIDRFAVDITNKQLLISFTLDENDTGIEYDLSDLYIDTSKTFVCANDPSQYALKIEAAKIEEYLKEQDPSIDLTTLTKIKVENFPVSFDDILSEDPENELYFLFLYELESPTDGDTPRRSLPVFGQTFSAYKVYNLILSFLNNVKKSDCSTVCKTDCSTVTPMLFYEGFMKAMTLGKYKTAIEFWNLFHSKKTNVTKNCGCNG